MSIIGGNPLYTSPTERLLYVSVSLFTMGIFAGMIAVASRTGLWTPVLSGKTILATVFGQTMSLSGALSVLFLGAGLIVVAVAAVLHIAVQIIARSAWRWT